MQLDKLLGMTSSVCQVKHLVSNVKTKYNSKIFFSNSLLPSWNSFKLEFHLVFFVLKFNEQEKSCHCVGEIFLRQGFENVMDASTGHQNHRAFISNRKNPILILELILFKKKRKL